MKKHTPLSFGRILSILAIIFSVCLPRQVASGQEGPLKPDASFRIYLPLASEDFPPAWLGPEGGTISAVEISPKDTNIVYAASWGGGVYRSNDGGKSWAWKSVGLGNLTVVSLAVDPADPAVVYAGTYKGQLYKSTNAAESWFLSSTGVQDGAIVYSIAVDPKRPQTVYMSTRGPSNNNSAPWKGVIYRSDDGGGSWVVKLANLGGKDVQDWAYALLIHPHQAESIFAATHEHGIYRSWNRGESWEPANWGITNFSTRALAFGSTEGTADIVYTGVWEKRGVFKSYDLGDSWELKDVGSAGAQIYAMDIDPLQPDVLYLATYNMGVLKTNNGGEKWVKSGLVDDPLATVNVHPGSSGLVFVGASGNGLWSSTDMGASWNHSQAGLRSSAVTGLVVSPDNPSVLFVATEGSGVLRSQDQGRSWTPFEVGLGEAWVNALVLQPQRKVMFALSGGGGLYRCDLQKLESCWQRVAVGTKAEAAPPSATVHLAFSPQLTFQEARGEALAPTTQAFPPTWPTNAGLLAMAFAPSDPSVGYLGAGGEGVFRTEDGGASWTPAGLFGRSIWALGVDPHDPQVLYAATDAYGGLYASQDGGRTWSYAPLPDLSLYFLAYSPAGILFAGTSDGIHRLSNGAWQRTGLAGQSVAALAFHPDNPDLLYAGSTWGAYVSADGGKTWRIGPPDLALHTVQAITFSGNDVYYCTTAHGVLQADLRD